VHIRIPTADDLRKAERKDIEGRSLLVAAKVEVNDLAHVEFTER
jgi:hypothetical protein